MNLKKILLGLLLASSFGATAIPAQAQISVDIAPPPVQYEAAPVPRTGYVWESGYWSWNGRRHVWVAGHWERARPGYAYTGPNWVERDGRWHNDDRRWDRDGDGVPDRRDRDMDGDGVPNRRDSHPTNPYRS